MTVAESKLESLISKLETERDELKVQLRLAKMEAREDWEELEQKLDALRGRGRMKVIAAEAKDATSDVGAAAEVLAEEIKEGFAKLRRLL